MNMAAQQSSIDKVHQSQKFFNKGSLLFYDLLLYGVISRFAWGATIPSLDGLYRKYITTNHLEVGVGTGFLLGRALGKKNRDMRLAFMDLSDACLARCQVKMAAFRPEVYRQNLLHPVEQNIPKFDSIAINSVMHCIPGSFRDKSIVFTHLKALMNTDAVLFGTTVLGKNVNKNLLAKPFMWLMNRLGVFNNQADTGEDLREYLEKNFKILEFNVVGVTAFFAVSLQPPVA